MATRPQQTDADQFAGAFATAVDQRGRLINLLNSKHNLAPILKLVVGSLLRFPNPRHPIQSVESGVSKQ